MQFALEKVTSEVSSVPGNEILGPEGAVSILFYEHKPLIDEKGGLAKAADGQQLFVCTSVIPIVIPRFQAMQLGMQIMKAARGGETVAEEAGDFLADVDAMDNLAPEDFKEEPK